MKKSFLAFVLLSSCTTTKPCKELLTTEFEAETKDKTLTVLVPAQNECAAWYIYKTEEDDSLKFMGVTKCEDTSYFKNLKSYGKCKIGETEVQAIRGEVKVVD